MDAKTVFMFFVLHRLCIQALPVNNVVENSSCIQVTKERAKELHEIGEEFNNFINELSDKHEDIDFTFVELKVENHDDNEDEEKETTLKITVNDCNNKAKNHPKIEDNFENDDVHGNNKTDDKPEDNIEESSNNRNENQIDNNEESSNNRNENQIKIIKSDQSQSESKISKTRNVSKTNKVESAEENVNETNEESTKISKNISNSNHSEVDKAKEELSDKTENDINEVEAVNSEDKKIKKKNLNKHEDLNPSTEDSENINYVKDKDTHTINRDIGNSNIVIYAPSIGNTEIEIGSDYQSFANMQNILRKLTDRQARFQIPNPNQFYESPIDNFDYSSYQPHDYDSYADDAFRNVRQKTNAYDNSGNENLNFEYGRDDSDLGANFNSGLWLQ